MEIDQPPVQTPKAPPEETSRININVPLSTRKRWKTHAAQVDRPLSEIVIEVMDKYLETQKAP